MANHFRLINFMQKEIAHLLLVIGFLNLVMVSIPNRSFAADQPQEIISINNFFHGKNYYIVLSKIILNY